MGGSSVLGALSEIRVETDFSPNEEFYSIPSSLYTPCFAPHRDITEQWLLSRGHPYWTTADARFFVAHREVPVGRVALILDAQHRERWGPGDAYVGFFDCCDDIEVAEALVAAVTTEARSMGVDRLLATANPSANYAVGVQVDGFDAPPVVLLSPGLPYYPKLFEELGFRGILDWRAVTMDREGALAGGEFISDRRRADEPGVQCRRPGPGEIWARRAELRDVYNSAFGDAWGFTPIVAQEFDVLIGCLGRNALSELTLLAYDGSALIGFVLTVRSTAPAGCAPPPPHVLWLCVSAEYQRRGVGIALVSEFVRAFGASSIPTVEYHIHDDDPFMNFVARSLDARVVKRYRLYALDLEGAR